jgi:sugar lactone lactonase YvrE
MTRSFRRGACAFAAAIGFLLVVAATTASAAAPVTPAGWRVHPLGTEIAVPQGTPGMNGPSGAALSPSGSQLLVASSGASQTESLDLFDLDAGARTSFLPFDATTGRTVFYGVAWSPDGTKAWASGGGQQVVHALSVNGGSVTEAATIPTATPCTAQTGDGACFPAGIAYGQTPIGPRLYVADNLSGPAGRQRGQPGRQQGDRDRSGHKRGHWHDRPRGAPAARGRRLRPHRPEGVHHQLDGSLGRGD